MAKAFPRALVWLAASAVTLGATSAAHGQAISGATAGSVGWSKTDAILGGAPSALQAIVAQQQGLPMPKPASYHPASYAASSYPTLVPAIYRDRPAVSEGVTSGRPDVFGSVALKVGNTPLNARWHRVEEERIDGPAGRFARSLTERGKLERLEAVNWYVNRRVQFVDDQKRWGRPDVWSTAAETLRSGRGDCEDYAIAKLQMLRRAGFSDRDLYLVVVKDLVTRQDHAVLVVRAEGKMLVLDSGTDQVLESEALHDYRPILTFASYGTWTHGYRVHSAPVNIASAEESQPKPLIPAENVQRSWSASLLAFNTGLSK
jgi:predicted transglutaminase-like cysteine proteinase